MSWRRPRGRRASRPMFRWPARSRARRLSLPPLAAVPSRSFAACRRDSRQRLTFLNWRRWRRAARHARHMHHPLDHGDRGDEREHGDNPEQQYTAAPRPFAEEQRGETEEQNTLRPPRNADFVFHTQRFGARPRVRDQKRRDQGDETRGDCRKLERTGNSGPQKIEQQTDENRPFTHAVERGIVKRTECRRFPTLPRDLPVQNV